MTTFPLTISSAYLDSYSPVINPYFTSTITSNTYYTDDGIYKTVIHPNPIKTFVSPLGVAAHPEPVVYHYKYNQYKKPKHSSKITITSPIVSPVITPVSSLYSVSAYDNNIDVNSDPSLRRKMTKYFYEETVNRWLYSDFSYVLKYLVVKGENVSIVENESKIESNDGKKNAEEKIDYIANNIMTKYDMKSFLKKLVNKGGINWYDLKENKKYVKKAIYKKIVKNLEHMMVH